MSGGGWHRAAPLLMALVALAAACRPGGPDVRLIRVPNGGLQPEAIVDVDGTVHLVYLAGEPSAADVFYTRSTDGAQTFSPPVRVNSDPGSAIATGTVRGAQIAVGRGRHVYVAWNGSARAAAPPGQIAAASSGAPMLYARLDAAAAAFEPQRNLMTRTADLDGGGSIAADRQGGVYVAWHARSVESPAGEAYRRVWLARSLDDGVTFDPERAVSDPATWVCGCCAVRLAAGNAGGLHLLYRAATGGTHRDVYSLVSRDRGETFTGSKVAGWEIGACPMTSMSIATGDPVRLAWETDGQVYVGTDGDPGDLSAPPGPTGGGTLRRKHPRLAVAADGSVALAWTEGTSWGRGGSASWQIFDASGRPTAVRGTAAGVPPWSFATAIARDDGGITVLY